MFASSSFNDLNFYNTSPILMLNNKFYLENYRAYLPIFISPVAAAAAGLMHILSQDGTQISEQIRHLHQKDNDIRTKSMRKSGKVPDR
jgi:hypothetical protein